MLRRLSFSLVRHLLKMARDAVWFAASANFAPTRTEQILRPACARLRSERMQGVVARLQLMTVGLELRSKRRKLAASSWIHMTLPAGLTGLLCICRRCRGLSRRENNYRGSEKQSGNRRSDNRKRF